MADSYPGYSMDVHIDGRLRSFTAGAWSYGSTTVTNRGRILVGVVFGGTTNAFYVNGLIDNINTGVAQPNAWAGVRALGSEEGGATQFGGAMDNVRIFNRSLTASEMLQIYNSGN